MKHVRDHKKLSQNKKDLMQRIQDIRSSSGTTVYDGLTPEPPVSAGMAVLQPKSTDIKAAAKTQGALHRRHK